jgi:hypothetical protein
MNAQLKVSGNIVRGISLAIMAIVLVVSAGQPGGVASAQPVNAPSAQAVAQIYYDFCPGPDHTTTNIMIKDVANLYSAHVRIPFDKNYLEIVSISTSTSIFAPPGTVAPMDISAFNASGEISFIATLENPQVPFNGTGTLFTITWSVKGPCIDGVETLRIPAHVPVVPPNPPQLSDRDGMDIPYTTASPCINTCRRCQISGKVLLQGHTGPTGQRPDYSGTDIMVSTERACPTNFTYSALWDWPGMIKKQTASDGSFNIDAGRDKSCLCIYAFQHGYLTALGQGPYPITSTVTMTDITLLGGDATQDDAINIFDLTLIASHYGESHPASAEAALADINGDNKVDIYDLALTAGNSGMARGPQKWYR